MKTFVVILLLVLTFSQNTFAQDATANYESEATEQKIYLKTFNIEPLKEGKKKVQYIQTFSKGKEYILKICDDVEVPEGVVLSLYNNRRQLLGTNLHNGEYQRTINFPCKATGLYYIVYSFEGDKEFSKTSCASSVLSLRSFVK